jgi:exonuclease III
LIYLLTNYSSSSKGGQRDGLNGVATFARKGLTQSASSSILEDEGQYQKLKKENNILNQEGRCLFTDHGEFVIFNLYVPNSGEQHCRYQFKMKFLESLLKEVSKQRLLGKKVIVLGDLNIAPRPVDVCRSYRKLLISDITNNFSLTQSNLTKKSLFCPTLNRDLINREIDQLASIVTHIQSEG